MIKLEAKTMTKAIERAKAAHPRVRVISADERTYAVTGSRGNAYTVRFAVANGHKLAECDCPARGLCYHIAAAASVNIGVQSMRGQAASAPAPAPRQPYCGDRDLQHLANCKPHITRSVERNHNGPRLRVVRVDNWLV